ncbi:MAG: methyltransferase domain-containing protein [Trueperaceae bacterium]
MDADRFSNQQHLLNDQYRDSRKLEARVALHQRFSTNRHGWHRWVFEHLRVPDGGRVLELGCGPGLLWRDRRVPESWKVTLSDFSPGMLEQARENLAAYDGFDFRLIDAQEIPTDDDSFDAVIANHMLYHLPDRERALAEIRRVLTPAGRFYAATNGAEHLRELEPFYRILDPGHRRMTEPFNLENGVGQLSSHFASVEVERYPDALVITEAEPLVAYILSTLTAVNAEPERLPVLRSAIVEELSEHGAIRVSKSTGLFQAHGLRGEPAAGS